MFSFRYLWSSCHGFIILTVACGESRRGAWSRDFRGSPTITLFHLQLGFYGDNASCLMLSAIQVEGRSQRNRHCRCHWHWFSFYLIDCSRGTQSHFDLAVQAVLSRNRYQTRLQNCCNILPDFPDFPAILTIVSSCLSFFQSITLFAVHAHSPSLRRELQCNSFGETEYLLKLGWIRLPVPNSCRWLFFHSYMRVVST